MRCADSNQHQNNDCRRNGQRDGQASAVLWPEIIQPAHENQHPDRGQADMVAQHLDPDDLFRAGGDVTQARPAAERRRHGEIGQQEQGAHHREQSAL